MLEIWKPILGYEGFYEVSSFGRVRRIIDRSGNPISRLLSPYVRKKGRTKGYHEVCLSKNGIKELHSLHVLVCTTFHGPKPSPIHQVNHDDGDKGHNEESNLYWATPLENTTHAIEVLGTQGMPVKDWFVTQPNGRNRVIRNMSAYCRERNLHISGMSAVARGKQHHHKGYKCSVIGRTF